MFCWWTAFAVIALMAPVYAQPQDPTFAIRVQVPIVSLEAVVLDANGRPVTNLGRDDFTIFEDGEQRDIQNFSAVEAPYSVLMLFQNTWAVSSRRPFMVDASNHFLDTLRPQDRVSIYTMESILRKSLDWRNAQTGKRVEAKVGAPDSVFNLYEALDDAFGKFGNIGGRKGIIVLTNGRDFLLFQEALQNGRFPSADRDNKFQKLTRKVRELGIPLYIIAVDTDRNLEPRQPIKPGSQKEPYAIPLLLKPLDEYSLLASYALSPGFKKIKNASPTVAEDFLVEIRSRLEHLAEVSGGRVYFPKGMDEVGALYEQIARELGTSYSFGFPPAATAGKGTHRIEIRVSDPKLRVVQSRQSYTVR